MATDDPLGAAVTLTGAPVGATLADAEGTPIANGTRVPDGTDLFVAGVDTPTSSMVVNAAADAEVPSGNVYLYDGNTPGVTTAQKLILAETATTRATAAAGAEAFAVGSLGVTKRIAGAGGAQGEVTVEVTCGGDALDPLVVPAGAPDGDTTLVYEDIEVGSTCDVVETADGANDQVSVDVTDGEQSVSIDSAARADAEPIVNAYAQVSPSTTSSSSTSTTSSSVPSTSTTGDVSDSGADRSGALPSTGSDAARLGLFAALAVGGGAVLAVAARRRRLS